MTREEGGKKGNVAAEKRRNDEWPGTNDEGNTEEISTLRKGVGRQAN